MSSRSMLCAWCGKPINQDSFNIVSDEGHRLCSNKCQTDWELASDIKSVKQNLSTIDEAAEIICSLLDSIDNLTGKKYPDWVQPNLSTARIWLGRKH